MKASGNDIGTTTANLYRSSISFGGNQKNIVRIGANTDLHHSSVQFKGKHNTLIVGRNCYLNGLRLIFEGDNNCIEIGDDVFILDDTRIYVADGSNVTIGDQCMFSDHIEIRTTDNHSIFDRATGLRVNYEKDVALEPQVWLGMHTIILKGTFLAQGTIVGAGSLVSGRHDTPNSVIAGNPAKRLRENVAWTMERKNRITPKQ